MKSPVTAIKVNGVQMIVHAKDPTGTPMIRLSENIPYLDMSLMSLGQIFIFSTDLSPSKIVCMFL